MKKKLFIKQKKQEKYGNQALWNKIMPPNLGIKTQKTMRHFEFEFKWSKIYYLSIHLRGFFKIIIQFDWRRNYFFLTRRPIPFILLKKDGKQSFLLPARLNLFIFFLCTFLQLFGVFSIPSSYQIFFFKFQFKKKYKTRFISIQWKNNQSR